MAGEHAALGRAGRPGRVDDRVQVLLVDRRRRLVEGGRGSPRRGHGPPDAPPRSWRRGAAPGALRRGPVLGQLVLVLADDADGVGVGQQVADVVRRARGGDRMPTAPTRASAKSSTAHSRLFRQQRERVAPADAAREQAARVRAHELVGRRQETSRQSSPSSTRYAGRSRPADTASCTEARDRPPSAGRTGSPERRTPSRSLPSLLRGVRARMAKLLVPL